MVYSINDFVKDFKIESVNHMKVDVDGNEKEILKGAGNVLASNNFKTLMVEADEYDAELFDYLEGFGLKQRKICNTDHPTKSNYFFLK